MTDRQPEPTTEAGRPPGYTIWRAWRDGMLAQGREVAPERMAWETLDQRDRDLDAAIEAEARADERERLAGAVPLLRHAAEYLSGEFGRTGKAEPNVLADRLQKLAAIEAEARADEARTNCAEYARHAVADERERLAGAVRALPTVSNIGGAISRAAVLALLQPDTAP